jgi:hypothetical protein
MTESRQSDSKLPQPSGERPNRTTGRRADPREGVATPSQPGDTRPPGQGQPRRRRWRSSQQAYEVGKREGFALALTLFDICLNADEVAAEIKRYGDNAAEAVRALMGTE